MNEIKLITLFVEHAGDKMQHNDSCFNAASQCRLVCHGLYASISDGCKGNGSGPSWTAREVGEINNVTL